MSCPNCGSWAVKADRSLGGRMVCGRCGQPLGGQVIPLRRPGRRGRRGPLLSLGRVRPWWLALGALLALSATLAGLETRRESLRTAPLPQRPVLPGGSLY